MGGLWRLGCVVLGRWRIKRHTIHESKDKEEKSTSITLIPFQKFKRRLSLTSQPMGRRPCVGRSIEGPLIGRAQMVSNQWSLLQRTELINQKPSVEKAESRASTRPSAHLFFLSSSSWTPPGSVTSRHRRQENPIATHTPVLDNDKPLLSAYAHTNTYPTPITTLSSINQRASADRSKKRQTKAQINAGPPPRRHARPLPPPRGGKRLGAELRLVPYDALDVPGDEEQAAAGPAPPEVRHREREHAGLGGRRVPGAFG